MNGNTTPPDRPAPNLGGNGGDYLWDGSGPIDARVAELERALSPLRHRGSLPAELTRPMVRRRRWVLWGAGLAAAAAIALVVSPRLFGPRLAPRGPESWSVATGEHYTTTLERPRANAQGATTGVWIETASNGVATLHGTSGGQVLLEGGTRAKILDLGATAQRLRLDFGSIFHQPTKSVVPVEIATPSGNVVIEPGTACVVQIGRDGRGRVEIKGGRAEIRDATRVTRLGRASVVALGGKSPGTPRRTGTTPEYADLLAKLDRELDVNPASSLARDVLAKALAMSHPGDEITLWNLMWRVDDEGRKAIVTRARGMGKAVHMVDDDPLIRGEADALEAWWRLIDP